MPIPAPLVRTNSSRMCHPSRDSYTTQTHCVAPIESLKFCSLRDDVSRWVGGDKILLGANSVAGKKTPVRGQFGSDVCRHAMNDPIGSAEQGRSRDLGSRSESYYMQDYMRIYIDYRVRYLCNRLCNRAHYRLHCSLSSSSDTLRQDCIWHKCPKIRI